MKSILMSIKPYWVSKILNREKTIEVRKKFPKNYVGWVYIYCTKSSNKKYEYLYHGNKADGRVVARFWCDEVRPNTWTNCLQGSCLSYEQIKQYTKGKDFVGVHISQLEIFDKPKELSGFNLKKAPQNYCYVGELENG